MSILISKRLRSVAINLSGLGLGIFWIWRDELDSSFLVDPPSAPEFPQSQIASWNADIIHDREFRVGGTVEATTTESRSSSGISVGSW